MPSVPQESEPLISSKPRYLDPFAIVFPLSLINWFANVIERVFGYKLFPIPAERLYKIADDVDETDLFGPQNQTLKGLKLALAGAENAPLSAFGRVVITRDFEVTLAARKAVMEYINKRPHIAQVEIKAPLIITGLPRSGSTYLQRLLACDPTCRSLYLCEMFSGLGANVVPKIDEDMPKYKSISEHPNVARFNRLIQRARAICPEAVKAEHGSHFYDAVTPDEEFFILHHQIFWFLQAPLLGKEYSQWLEEIDNKGEAYRYLKRFLQLLTLSKAPQSHWLLKTPVHSAYPSILMDYFPDARVIVTHRDPRRVVPSLARLCATVVGTRVAPHSFDKRELGQYYKHSCIQQVERLAAYRKSLPADGKVAASLESQFLKQRGRRESVPGKTNSGHVVTSSQFIDIQYDDILNDPIGTVKRIYSHYGMPFSDAFLSAMKSYIESNPQGKHGRQKYDLDEFGLTEEEVEHAFHDYMKSYGY